MKCPKCGAQAKVIDVADVPENQEKYRKKVCTECEHVFYTVEFEAEVNESFKKLYIEHSRKYKNNHNQALRRSKHVPPCPVCGNTVCAVNILEDEETGLLYKVFTCADCGREYEDD